MMYSVKDSIFIENFGKFKNYDDKTC